MTNNRERTYRREAVIVSIAAFLLFLVSTDVVFCAERGDLPHQDISSEELSGDAAKVVASHLAAVLRLLHDGGPPVAEKDVQRKKWTVTETIRQFYGQSMDSYSREQYLIDYRESFLNSWQKQFASSVHRQPSGEVLISGGGWQSCCFQSAGATHGHYDATAVVNGLIHGLVREKLNRNVDANGNKRLGSFTTWSSARDAPTASSEAIMHLFSLFAEEEEEGNALER